MTIDDEIQQTTWKSPLQKAVVNTMFTSRFLEEGSSQMLKPYGLTPQQFNILRILRGQRGKPATVKLLVERMLDKSSNASRLVDKLLEKGLLVREVCPVDRRAVEIRITDLGLDLLQSIDSQNLAWESQAEGFSAQDAQQLSDLLDQLRQALRHQSSSKPCT